MKSVHRSVEVRYEERRSLFITRMVPVETQEAAEAVIAAVKEEHARATHNVYAYIVGPDQRIQKMSDDGEPSGTAGMPSLEVLRKRGLTDLVAVTTRYFGGIKLGAGGLIRAYAKGVVLALDEALEIEKMPATKISLSIPYDKLGAMDYFLGSVRKIEDDRRYLAEVELDLILLDVDKEIFVRQAAEILGAIPVTREEPYGTLDVHGDEILRPYENTQRSEIDEYRTSD